MVMSSSSHCAVMVTKALNATVEPRVTAIAFVFVSTLMFVS